MTKTQTSKLNKRNQIQKAKEEDVIIEAAILQAKAESEFGVFNQDITPKKNINPNRNDIRSKIGEKSILRSSKDNREAILDKVLHDIGIDKEKFKADLEAIKKQGGLELNIKN
jgi:hypothetical protein